MPATALPDAASTTRPAAERDQTPRADRMGRWWIATPIALAAVAAASVAFAEPRNAFLNGTLLLLAACSTAVDLRWHRIPNGLSIPALLSGLAVAATLPGLTERTPIATTAVESPTTSSSAAAASDWMLPVRPLRYAASGALIGFALTLAVFLFGGCGGGDVKLAAAYGSLLGWELSLEQLIVTHLSAVAGGIALGVWRYGPRHLSALFGMAVVGPFAAVFGRRRLTDRVRRHADRFAPPAFRSRPIPMAGYLAFGAVVAVLLRNV